MTKERSSHPYPNRDEIISYQKLRAFIGFTGILLPIIVVLGCAVFGAGPYAWQISVSHYYYSIMHITFVCILCVLGGFLITYKGKDRWESRLSNLAGFCAFGIASFPTKFEGFIRAPDGTNQYLQLMKNVSDFWGAMHFVFAGLLFTCFIIFCLHFFQKPDRNYSGAEEKKFKRRKLIYRICGWAIVVSIIMIGLFNFVIGPKEGFLAYSTFIFETTSLWAFGLAWLVKGSAVLKDVPVVKKVVEVIR
jgi:magnesium-transporting ATPase (P-type)